MFFSRNTIKKTPKNNFKKNTKETENETDLLVNLDADGALGDIPDTACTSMVELVGHTFVNGAVHFDVNVVADFVSPKVSGQGDVTLLSEGACEQIPCSGPQTVTGRHV